MLIAAGDARDLAADVTEAEFLAELRHQYALAKAVELIGEAAGKVSNGTRQAHPEIAWPEIIAVRHRLVHDYQGIDLGRLWRIVREDIPPLIAALEAIVPKESET